MDKKEMFALANDIDFYDACLNFTDTLKISSNPLQTVGHRMALIEELYKNGFVITKTDHKVERLTYKVDPKAVVEVINFDETKSWIRWYLPDFSNNGNIDLPEGNYSLKHRVGNQVTVEKITK